MTFGDLSIGDTFSFAAHAGRESWEKTGPNRARVVNSDYARNTGVSDPVNLLYAAADRAARLRSGQDFRLGQGHELERGGI
jgi:hypothetical protein